MVAARLQLEVGLVRHACAAAGQAGGAAAVHGELVLEALRDAALVIHDEQVVGQVEHQVALFGRARQRQRDGLELERKVVAERPVQAEVRIVARKQVHQRTHDRERGRLTAALFLLESPVGPLHAADHCAWAVAGLVAEIHDAGSAPQRCQRLVDGLQQHGAPLVQSAHPDVLRPAGDGQRRVGEAHVPAGVAARVFVARRQQHAAGLVQPVDEVFDLGVAVDRRRSERDCDAPAGLELRPARIRVIRAHGTGLLGPRSQCRLRAARSQVQASAAGLDAGRCDGVHVALAQDQEIVAVHLDFVTILGAEQHPVAFLGGPDVRPCTDHFAPYEALVLLGGRRDQDPAAGAPF